MLAGTDLDDETINDFLSMVRAARRRPVGSEGINEILSKLELLQNGQPTRAAYYCLVNIQKIFSGCVCPAWKVSITYASCRY